MNDRHLVGEPFSRPLWVINALLDEHKRYLMAIETEMLEFYERCKRERKQRYLEICERYGKKCAKSKFVVIYHNTKGYPSLGWGKFKYYRGKRSKFPHRISNVGLTYNLGTIRAGAHPDEIDLIDAHEIQARRLRAVQKGGLELGRLLKREHAAAQRLADLWGDPMIQRA
ncbi:MAG: hypothetical protein JSS25_05270 [Proteobacteria bacterium]|nr:hypothetical protein [Pseudomonadota bacterium]